MKCRICSIHESEYLRFWDHLWQKSKYYCQIHSTVYYTVYYIPTRKGIFYKYFNPWLFPPFSDKILEILDSAEKEIPKKKYLYGSFPTKDGRHSQTHLAFGNMNKLDRREVSYPNKSRVLFIWLNAASGCRALKFQH